MHLSLTKRGDYVVRAALALARAEAGEYVKAREIAGAMHLPPRYTPQLLKLLCDAGLAEAKAGKQGGYRLTRPASKITLLEVVEAGEGTVRPRRCALRDVPCNRDGACAFHPAWARAWQAWTDSLGRETLLSVVMSERDISGGAAAPSGEDRTGPEAPAAAK